MRPALLIAGAVGLMGCATAEPAGSRPMDELLLQSATCVAAAEHLQANETAGSDRHKALRLAAVISDMELIVFASEPAKVEAMKARGREAVAAKVSGKSPAETEALLMPLILDCMPDDEEAAVTGGVRNG